MGSSGTIEHLGVISEIGDKMIKVDVMPEQACGGCHAKGSCSIGSNAEKTVEVLPSPGEYYSVGQQIKVVLDQSLGIKALVIGYLFPFIVVLAMLITLTSLEVNEGIAALLSLAALVPYFAGLTFYRDRLKKEFSFRLKKINTS